MEIEKHQVNLTSNRKLLENGEKLYLLSRQIEWKAENDISACEPLLVESYISSHLETDMGTLDRKIYDFTPKRKVKYLQNVKQECVPDPNEGEMQADRFCSILSQLLNDESSEKHVGFDENCELNQVITSIFLVIWVKRALQENVM